MQWFSAERKQRQQSIHETARLLDGWHSVSVTRSHVRATDSRAATHQLEVPPCHRNHGLRHIRDRHNVEIHRRDSEEGHARTIIAADVIMTSSTIHLATAIAVVHTSAIANVTTTLTPFLPHPPATAAPAAAPLPMLLPELRGDALKDVEPVVGEPEAKCNDMK